MTSRLIWTASICLWLALPAMCTPIKKITLAVPNKPNLVKTDSAAKVQVPQVSGVWQGNACCDDQTYNIDLSVEQDSESIRGTLKSTGNGGTIVHYLKGTYKTDQRLFSCEDIGMDKSGASTNLSPMPASHYEFYLVDDGKKLVGSTEPQSNTKVWLTLAKVEINNTQTSPIKNSDNRTVGDKAGTARSQSDSPTFGSPTKQPTLTASNSDTDSRETKVENDLTAGGKVTPAVLAYVNYVGQLLGGHEHLPKVPISCLLKTHLRVSKDGTITIVRMHTWPLDTKADLAEYNRADLEAIRAVEIYTRPPQTVLDDLKADHVDICSTTDPQADETVAKLPESIAYMKDVQKTIKDSWAGAARGMSPQPRRVRVYFRIHRNGYVSDLNLDPSSNIDSQSNHIDAYAETGLAAIRASSPFKSPPESVLDKIKVDYVSVSFTFDYKVPNRRRYVMPLFVPYRGFFIL